MNVSLYQAAAGLTANAQWQDAIGQNLAASSVPGFKKQDVSFASIAAGTMSPDTARMRAGVHDYLLTRSGATTNFSEGELRYTGVPTDLALHGPGFFELQMPNGDVLYTRNGGFHMDSTGRLVSASGYPILGDAGVIQLDPRGTLDSISINAQGEVLQDGAVRGRIRIAQFADPDSLSPRGAMGFVPEDPNTQPFEATGTSVEQGFLEASNASALNEMAGLIMASRLYEANQRVVRMQDERMERAISSLSSTN